MITILVFLALLIPAVLLSLRYVIKKQLRFVDFGSNPVAPESLVATRSDNILGFGIVITSTLGILAAFYVAALLIVGWFELEARPALPVLTASGLVTESTYDANKLTLSYRYEVAGTEYTNSAVFDFFPAWDAYFGREDGDAAYEQYYQEGSPIRVVYHPLAPDEGKIVRQELPAARINLRTLGSTGLLAIALIFPSFCIAMPISIIVFGVAGLSKMGAQPRTKS